MIQKLEELSMNAWPALHTVIYDGWVIRLAGGYTKRANSVNPLFVSSENTEQKIDTVEALYRSQRLPAIFKMTEASCPNGLDRELDSKCYVRIDETSVQMLELAERRQPSMSSVLYGERLTDEWLKDFVRLDGHKDPEQLPIMKQIHAGIIPRTCFMTLVHNGETVACALGVLERGYLGILDVVTGLTFRNRGFGEQLLLNLLDWGRDNGASHAYLQVVRSNAPAARLYAKLGFQEVYRYWYRVKP